MIIKTVGIQKISDFYFPSKEVKCQVINNKSFSIFSPIEIEICSLKLDMKIQRAKKRKRKRQRKRKRIKWIGEKRIREKG